MKFDKPSSVANIVYWLKQADLPRSTNRALVNALFNGNQPYTDHEADENNINTNVNFLDAPRIAHDARSTFNNAFLKPGNFFAVTLDQGPAHKRSQWGRIITREINRTMKRSETYVDTLRSEFAQTVLHGVGPSLWDNRHSWCPTSVAIDDLMIPSRTRVGFDNLDYFAVFRQYTPAKLWKMTHGGRVDKGWNMALVKKLLKQYHDEYGLTPQNTSANYLNSPEKLEETIKADLAYFDSETVPTIDCWDFYYKDDESEGDKWQRKMILDYGDRGLMEKEDFLFNPERVEAEKLCYLLHVMFADGANVAPFRYHSVRGLGWLLYAVCHLQNRLRCKFNDAAFEQMLWYFRVASPEDRERINKIDLHHLGVIPDGVDFVKAAERYQVNQGLIGDAFNLNRQSMLESAAQFKPDLDQGSSREMTAQEVMARVNAANAMVGSMLNLAYTLQTHQYREICRRFTLKGSTDKEVKDFQERVQKQGVPAEALDIARWDIEPERVLGAGNKTLEIAQAQKLMEARALYDPEPQREILHIYTEAMTDDPAMAERLVPMSKKVVSDSVHDAQLTSAALMMGLPVSMKTGMNHVEYVEAMLVSLGAVVQRIEQGGNMATPQEVAGLQNLLNHTQQHIAIIAQAGDKQRVKRYMDAVGQFANIVTGFAQRLAEQQMAAQQQMDPETQAKIQGQLMKDQVSAQAKENAANQRLAQRQQAHEQRLTQDAQRHTLDMGKMTQTAELEAATTDVKTAANVRSTAAKTAADVRAKEIKATQQPPPSNDRA